ncbi:MAG: hypothetical protein HY287_01355 [Planctomycetes bacterium]|nr:hypothetical protein [Planctomycetota bacterium]MBI3832954.1 hypothetical protein [Planctomycetota bacterium]
MTIATADPSLVHYVPIATTALSAIFCGILLQRYMVRRSGAHLLWWAGGIACYGLGTALESAVTLFGNSPGLNKAWYIAGALLGGYPLAQGSVYLLLPRQTAKTLSMLTVPFIVFFSVMVIFSPIDLARLEPQRPGGAALMWQWIRWFTPIINLYAVVFLIGGAMLSSMRFFLHRETHHRALGNALIAIGAMLPGVGGTLAKAGRVEALYVGEFAGLILICLGYRSCVKMPLQTIEHRDPQPNNPALAPVRV